MQMRISLIAVLAVSLCASWTGAFATDIYTYKPDGTAGPRRHVGRTGYRGAPYRAIPIRDCGFERSFETLGFDDENALDRTMGCSTRGNLALMVSKRKDLIRGRGTPFSDGERASNIVSDYRAWKQRPQAQPAQEQ